LVVGGADSRHVREHFLDLLAVAPGGDERDVVLAQELDDQPGREPARAVDDDGTFPAHARSRRRQSRRLRSWLSSVKPTLMPAPPRSCEPEQADGVLLQD